MKSNEGRKSSKKKERKSVLTMAHLDYYSISEVEVDNFFLDKQFDWVIHCAIRGGRRINNDPKNILSDNLLMFYNLMRNQSKFKFLINFVF